MSKSPYRVSVVVCAIQPSRYLNESVACLLNQTESSVQVVVVWDTGEPIDRQSWEIDRRVKIVSTGRRSGTPNALNVGIANSDAPLVARLDHDDLSPLGRLARQCQYLDEHPDVLAVGAWADLINSDGEFVGAGVRHESGDVRSTLLRRNPLVHSSMVFRRSALDDVGGYDARATRMQDYELILRLARLGPIHILDEVLVFYRLHPDQFSRVTSPYAAYTRLVLKGRMALARTIGTSAAVQRFRNSTWFIAQVLRYQGLRKPRYAKGLTSERSR